MEGLDFFDRLHPGGGTAPSSTLSSLAHALASVGEPLSKEELTEFTKLLSSDGDRVSLDRLLDVLKVNSHETEVPSPDNEANKPSLEAD